MSEALRSIFAEFGFDVDTAKLDALDKSIRETITAENKLAKANDVAVKKVRETVTFEQRLAKIREQAAEQRGDHAAKAAWMSSGEGQAHSAWQRETAEIKAFSDIAERVTQGTMVRMGERLRGLSPRVEALAKRFNLSSEAVGKIFTGASVAAVTAIVAATRAAFQFADAFAADAEALRDTARESRVTTTELQQLDHAAAQGGVGVERMRAGVATFGQSLRAAGQWGNGTTATLRRLGIQARDASGHIRPTGELLDEVAVAMEHVENPTRRVRIATELFGAAGRRMLDVLHTGPGGIAALRAELEELGGGITPEATAAAHEYTQATERMGRATDSLRSVLAVSLIPALSWLVEKGARLGGLFANLTRGTHVVKVGLVGLAAAAVSMAAPMIAAWLPVALPFVVIAAKVAFLAALFDDLITFAEGGDSAIGRLIDTIAGAGTAVELAKELREDWEAISKAIDSAVDAVASFAGQTASGGVASGTLRGPTIGGRRATAGGAPMTIPAGNGAFRMSLPVPATRAVVAPGAVASRTRVTQVNRTSAPVMHFHGVTDANVIAGRVRDVIREEGRAERDGDHPLDDDDGDDSPNHGVE